MTERTLALVKSGAVARGQADAIVARAEAAGLKVVDRVAAYFSRQLAEAFYGEHAGRDYFERLIGSVTGEAGVVAFILEGENAVKRWREIMGPTDPTKAPKGTIRGDFGTEMPDNAAHGSDSPENAAREIKLLASLFSAA